LSSEIQQLLQALQSIEKPVPRRHRKQIPVPPKQEPDAISLNIHSDTLNLPRDGELEWQHTAYKRLAFVVFMQGLNDIIRLLYKWKDNEWMYTEYKNLKSKSKTFQDLTEHHNMDAYQIRILYYDYEQDWSKDPIEWMMSERAKPYLEILDIEPEAAIELAHQVVSDDRQIGISEPDIELLLLPQYDGTSRKHQAMGRFLQTSFASMTKKNADTR